MADRRNTGFIRSWIFTSIAVLAATKIVPGISAGDWPALLITALLLGIFNAFLKPILFLLTLPLQIVTLGLFTLVINALLLMFAGVLVRDFRVDGFWPAFFGGLVISIISGFLGLLFGGGKRHVEAHVRTESSSSRKQSKDLGDGPVIDV